MDLFLHASESERTTTGNIVDIGSVALVVRWAGEDGTLPAGDGALRSPLLEEAAPLNVSSLVKWSPCHPATPPAHHRHHAKHHIAICIGEQISGGCLTARRRKRRQEQRSIATNRPPAQTYHVCPAYCFGLRREPCLLIPIDLVRSRITLHARSTIE